MKSHQVCKFSRMNESPKHTVDKASKRKHTHDINAEFSQILLRRSWKAERWISGQHQTEQWATPGSEAEQGQTRKNKGWSTLPG